MPAALAERASAELMEAGTLGVEVISEGREHELLGYFPASGDSDLEPALRARLAPLGCQLEATQVPEVDWVARFREQFLGARAGRVRIVPVWRDEPEAPGELRLRVDPGGAFGTGSHETTRLCLSQLQQLPPGERLLDVGCGTGLLAIAGLALGWRRALAIDLDPTAVAEARRHAQLNRVRLDVVRGDGARCCLPGRHQLLLANLALELLLERRDELARSLTPGGVAILSGLLREQLDAAAAAWGALGRVSAHSEGEWGALAVRLR